MYIRNNKQKVQDRWLIFRKFYSQIEVQLTYNVIFSDTTYLMP